MKLIYSMANISQTGLLEEASQDTTDNSKDSEQNLQLLEFTLIEPKKVAETTRELENCTTCKNQPFTYGKKRKLGSPFRYAVIILLSHLYSNICSRRLL